MSKSSIAGREDLFAEVAKAFGSSVATSALEEALGRALKTSGDPKVSSFVETNEGEYNAVALPSTPFSVVSVKDKAQTKPKFSLSGSQVVAARPLKPPVEISFVSNEDRSAWLSSLIEEVRLELSRTAPQG